MPKPHNPGPRPPPPYAGLAASVWLGAPAALPMARAGLAPWTPPLAAEGAELARRLAAADFDALARAVEAEARARCDQFAAGVARYRAHPHRRDAKPRPVLWKRGAASLRDHASGATPGPPVLLVPSLVNRSYILDLAPGRSLAGVLAGRGLRPLILDWGEPGGEESGFSLGDYVLRRLEPAHEAACAVAGRPVPAVGYCMGGLLALALAMRRADSVSALALLATPWDFHADGGAAAALLRAAEPWIADEIDRGRTLPAAALRLLFAAVQPAQVAARFRAFAALPPDSPDAAAFVDIEDWLNDGVALAGPAAREALFDWFVRNVTAAGRWRVAGEPVTPASLERPALVFAPGRDRIVPPESAAALAAALPRAQLRRPRAGHVGMVAGRRAVEDCARPLADWLLAVAE